MVDIRETEKKVNIEGREFIIHKFDPLFGSYIGFKLFSLSEGKSKVDVAKFLSKFMDSDYETFANLNKKILKYCSEVLAAGTVPVINSEGNIAVIGLNSSMITNLLIECISFNIMDFFEQKPQKNPDETLATNTPE